MSTPPATMTAKLDEEERRDDRQRAECGGQDEARGGRRSSTVMTHSIKRLLNVADVFEFRPVNGPI